MAHAASTALMRQACQKRRVTPNSENLLFFTFSQRVLLTVVPKYRFNTRTEVKTTQEIQWLITFHE